MIQSVMMFHDFSRCFTMFHGFKMFQMACQLSFPRAMSQGQHRLTRQKCGDVHVHLLESTEIPNRHCAVHAVQSQCRVSAEWTETQSFETADGSPLETCSKHVRNISQHVETHWKLHTRRFWNCPGSLEYLRCIPLRDSSSGFQVLFRVLSSITRVVCQFTSPLPGAMNAPCYYIYYGQQWRQHVNKLLKHTMVLDPWFLWALLNFKDFLFGLNSPGISRLSSKKDKECTHTFCIILLFSWLQVVLRMCFIVFLFEHVNPHTDSLNPPPCTSGNWIACRRSCWRSVDGSVLKRADSVYILFTLCLLCLLLLKRSLTSTASGMLGRACQVQGHGSRKDMKRHCSLKVREILTCVSWRILT